MALARIPGAAGRAPCTAASGVATTAGRRMVTVARDLAVLGMALREHFPQYYPYFSVRSFTYGRQRIANIRDELRAYDRAREKLTIKPGR